jgi:hypothetical protein
MFEETDLVLNIESVPSNISNKSFKTLLMQNTYTVFTESLVV